MGSRFIDKASLGSPFLEDRPDLYLFDRDSGNEVWKSKLETPEWISVTCPRLWGEVPKVADILSFQAKMPR